MQLTDKDGNIFGTGGLEITTSSGKPKVPVINTDITIGVTSIVGGVVGRLLFEGAGNVVQESSGLTYNDTTKTFTLIGPIGSIIQHTALTNYNGLGGIQLNVSDGTERAFFKLNPTSGEVRIGATGSGYFPTFYAQGVEAMRIFASTRNVAINTTTDAGFRFDVAGTARIQSTLSISNPSFISGGSITHSANATLVITGGPGGGTENITFGPTNRIFINATQSRFPNGSVQIASTLSVGVANATSQNMIWATGGITASSAIARGIYTDTTLTASANNDFLVGLDVQPTFTNGAFTGVTNLALRTTGQVRLNANGEISSFQGYGSDIFRVHSNANGLLEIGQNLVTPIGSPSAKATIYNRNNTYFAISINVPASQLGKGAQITWNNQGQGGGTIYHSNEVLYDMGMVNANSHYLHMFASGNVLLTNGTRTDAGYKLDVNGTARVQGASTFNNSLTNTLGGFSHSSASPSNDAFFTLLSSNIRFYVSSNGYCKMTTSIVADTNGVGSVNASAISQIDSTTKGFLPPRMTNAQMLAISTPATGLMVYDTTNNKLCCYDGTTWQNLF